MFKHILAQAGDINWMALFALLTFFSMFLISLWVVVIREKGFYDHMARLPLDDEEPDFLNLETTGNHEK